MTGAADLSLSGWLPDRAALTPDRVAIEFGDRQISYAELAAFAAAGLKPGDRVATLARNCPSRWRCSSPARWPGWSWCR